MQIDPARSWSTSNAFKDVKRWLEEATTSQIPTMAGHVANGTPLPSGESETLSNLNDSSQQATPPDRHSLWRFSHSDALKRDWHHVEAFGKGMQHSQRAKFGAMTSTLSGYVVVQRQGGVVNSCLTLILPPSFWQGPCSDWMFLPHWDKLSERLWCPCLPRQVCEQIISFNMQQGTCCLVALKKYAPIWHRSVSRIPNARDTLSLVC